MLKPAVRFLINIPGLALLAAIATPVALLFAAALTARQLATAWRKLEHWTLSEEERAALNKLRWRQN